MGLQGKEACLDEWVRQNQELVEEHKEELEKLADLVAATQLESIAKQLLEQGECTEEDVARMFFEAKLGKVMASDVEDEEEKLREQLVGELDRLAEEG